ncbi:MAG TPA: hypothetical protein VL460_00795 [Caulobacteraceae bacterium]|jgi:hypothetical protein|nr:hypothetical protein [Caulobacteraceae bacterium]
MIDATDFLCYASSLGALIGAGAYIYGYIIKAKGNRQLHTASLLFSGFGLANLPIVLRSGAHGADAFNGAVLVVFLLLGMICQAATAFRGRKSDRRVEQPASDTASAIAPEAARAA